MKFFDTHFHLYDNDSFADIYQNAQNAGVSRLLLSGTSWQDSTVYRDLADQYEGVYSSVGCHPHDADHCDDLGPYRELLGSSNKIKAVGEVGLDYYYEYSDREKQKQIFTDFIHLAEEFKKPLVIHCRQAEEDCYNLLKALQPTVPWSIHCFTGSRAWVEKLMEIGGFISVGGILTFKKSDDVRDMFAAVPDDRFFLETDSPYLAPMPHRGQRNQPAYLPHIAQYVANLRHWSLETCAQITNQNACQFFGI